ncbi:MAG: hypothetical protein Kow0031_23030 [Anaerolineae bacterium]
MIHVNRIDKPLVLQRHGQRWLADLQEAIENFNQIITTSNTTTSTKKLAKNKVARAQQKYNHKEIKLALIEMFHGKCAYCESLITVVTYGNIEHYYPKSKYIDKTFEWENMLLACDICNNPRHKGSKFPIDPDGKPLLLDPTSEVTDPNTHLRFIWDERAGLASVYGSDTRGQVVESVFDLNGIRGRKDLVRARSSHVKQLMILLKFAQNGNQEAISILQDACKPDAPYSAFALAYIAPNLP